MKKRYWIGIACALTLILAAVVLFVCLYNPYNNTERERWDLYASIDCLVKTSFNKDGNPVRRELYETKTLACTLVQHYRYDRSGKLSDFRVDGKGLSTPYFKGARFSLTYNKESNRHSAKPICGNKEYDSVSISWTESGKLESEYAKWIVATSFVYDETGRVVQELDGDKQLIHHDSDDKKSILVTEEGTLTEVVSLTLGENGMPKALKRSEYTVAYSYTKKNLCNKISIQVVGQTVGEVAIAYDKKGNPVKREVKAQEDGKTTVAALYEYAYDATGNMTEETISTADESLALKVISNGKYRYDKNGNMIEETVGDYTSSGKLLAFHKRLYQYDGDGNRIRVDYTKTGPSSEVVKSKSSTRYYADGTLRGTTSYELYANWSTKKIVDTEYTKDGYVLKQETQNFRQGDKVDGVLVDGILSSQTLFESTKKGVPRQSRTENYDEDGSLTSDTTRLYFNKGKAEKTYDWYRKEYRITGGTTKSIVTNSYFYTGQIRTTTTKEYSEDGELEKNEKIEYDINGAVVYRGQD